MEAVDQHVPRTTYHEPRSMLHLPRAANRLPHAPLPRRCVCVGVCFVQCPHTHTQTHIQRANCNANKSNVLDKQRLHKRRNQTSEQTKRTPQASPKPASAYLPPFLPLHVAISQWQIWPIPTAAAVRKRWSTAELHNNNNNSNRPIAVRTNRRGGQFVLLGRR